MNRKGLLGDRFDKPEGKSRRWCCPSRRTISARIPCERTAGAIEEHIIQMTKKPCIKLSESMRHQRTEQKVESIQEPIRGSMRIAEGRTAHTHLEGAGAGAGRLHGGGGAPLVLLVMANPALPQRRRRARLLLLHLLPLPPGSLDSQASRSLALCVPLVVGCFAFAP